MLTNQAVFSLVLKQRRQRKVVHLNIFLTGVTGIVGGRILLEILRYTSANCYCLVRDKDRQQAHKRIVYILNIYGMQEQEYLRWQNRLNIVLGDVSQARFALDACDYSHMVQQIEITIHMAANINLLASYSKLYKTNVEGTNNIIEFCLESGCPLIHGSTYSVIGDKIYQQNIIFTENQLNIGQKFPESNYERSKFEAEQIIHQATSKGLRWVILRLGEVMGDSSNGSFPLEGTSSPSLYYNIFKTVIETGIAPFCEDRYYITPVDYAAKATLYSALNASIYQSTLHIVNPIQNHFYQVMNLLVECGYSLRILPYTEYKQIFSQNKIQSKGKAYHSLFTRMITGFPYIPNQVESAKIDTRQTDQILHSAGICCPLLHYNLIAIYLNFCIINKYIPAPSEQRPLPEIL